MEKRTPHTRLDAIQNLVRDGRVCITNTALISASQIGFQSKREIFEVVMALKTGDFYVSGNLLIVSFKEL